jgi:hypothetical protein
MMPILLQVGNMNKCMQVLTGIYSQVQYYSSNNSLKLILGSS